MIEETHFENINNPVGVIQGHTAKMFEDKETGFWRLICTTCGWTSTGCSLEEVRFDFRYHGLKTSEQHRNIDWNKLL